MWTAHACRFRQTIINGRQVRLGLLPRPRPRPLLPCSQQTALTESSNFISFDIRYVSTGTPPTKRHPQSGKTLRSQRQQPTTQGGENDRHHHHHHQQQQQKVSLKEKTDQILFTTHLWGEIEWKLAESCLKNWALHPKKEPHTLHLQHEILQRMIRESKKNSNKFVVRTDHLNWVLHRWKMLSTHPKLDRLKWSAAKVLSRMDELASTLPTVELDTRSYALIMGASLQQDPFNAYKFCSLLFRRISTPNTVVYNYLIEAHIRSNMQNGPLTALSVFDTMLEDPFIFPDEKTLTRAFQSLMMIDKKPVIEAMPYIHRALHQALESSKDAFPNSLFLNIVLERCQKMKPPRVQISSMVPLADALMTVVSEKAKEYPHLEPNTTAYCSIIHMWATNIQLPGAAIVAESWLEKLLNKYDLESTPSIDFVENYKIIMNCCVLVVNCLAKSGEVERATAWLDSMILLSDNFAEIQSESINYFLVLRTWATNGGLSLSREEDLIRFMINEFKLEGKGHVGKFARLVRDLVINGNAEKAATLLERAAYEYPGAFEEVETGTELCHMVTKSILRLPDVGRIDVAAELLKTLTINYLDGSLLVKPSSKSIGSVMLEAANRGKDTLVSELWLALQDLQGTNEQDPDFIPDADALTALCKTNTGSVARTGSALHRMLDGAKKRNDNSPSEALLDFVLDSLAKSGDRTAGKRAELILLKTQELYEDGVSPKPTWRRFHQVIDCWVASCEEDSNAAARAEEILGLAETLGGTGDKVMQPSSEGYTSVMKAWGKSHAKDAPEHIQNLILRMKEQSEEGRFPFKPGLDAYIALLSAYANSGRDDAGRMAQTVFEGAPEEFKETRLFNALIAAQGGDTNRAEAILHSMHKAYLEGTTICKPDTESFNNVLLAWSRSGSPMAAWRADSIFERMSTLTKKGELDVRPNGTTFDIVITIISNEWGADAATKVDHYLLLLKEYYASGEPDCIPGVASYTEAIRAWGSNVDDPRAVLRARALLDEMHVLARAGASTVKPDRDTYLVYLQALSLSSLEDKEELARDALETMKENNIIIDQDLMSLWQRCLLPMRSMSAYWTLPHDDTDEFPSSMTPTKEEIVNTLS